MSPHQVSNLHHTLQGSYCGTELTLSVYSVVLLTHRCGSRHLKNGYPASQKATSSVAHLETLLGTNMPAGTLGY